MSIEPTAHAVRLRRRMIDDPYSGGETLGAWDAAAEATIPGCLLAPGTTETVPGVDLEQAGALATLYMPLGADVQALDRIRTAGSLWDVVGRRADWPGQLVSGSTVTLRWLRDDEGA